MSCGCKGGGTSEIESVKFDGVNYLSRIINFLIITTLFVIGSPFILLFAIGLIFHQTVLNKPNSISNLVKTIIYFRNKYSNRVEDEGEDEDEVEDEEDFDDLEIIGLERVEKNEKL